MTIELTSRIESLQSGKLRQDPDVNTVRQKLPFCRAATGAPHEKRLGWERLERRGIGSVPLKNGLHSLAPRRVERIRNALRSGRLLSLPHPPPPSSHNNFVPATTRGSSPPSSLVRLCRCNNAHIAFEITRHPRPPTDAVIQKLYRPHLSFVVTVGANFPRLSANSTAQRDGLGARGLSRILRG
jgi:hypothetical protein